MADMYGAVRSNWFKVKDPSAFKKFFKEKCYFGGEIELFYQDPDIFAFGGYEMYPSAYPRFPNDCDRDWEEWALTEFADEIRKHLCDGQEFRVLAAGDEKLRYVGVQHLVITKDTVVFNDYYEGN